MYRPATILGSLVALVAAVGLFFTGDIQGKLMFVQQPMKMASAESLCHTETDPTSPSSPSARTTTATA